MKMEEDELCKSRSHVMRENDDDVALLMPFHSRSIYESVFYVNAMRSSAAKSPKIPLRRFLFFIRISICFSVG
jgi:hypothetical protein